jgi:hypothetical protein
LALYARGQLKGCLFVIWRLQSAIGFIERLAFLSRLNSKPDRM